MSEPFKAVAAVKEMDGLVCIAITAPGAPETVLRLPRELATKMARQILTVADRCPASWVTDRDAMEGRHE